MELYLHIRAEFDAVYLINGVFIESAETLRYNDADALYITVLPLKAALLPYTVKFADGKALSNADICFCYRLPQNHRVIKFKERYNYVYSPSPASPPAPPPSPRDDGTAAAFFRALKSNDLLRSRGFLTPGLSNSLSDADLIDFFSAYVDIEPNKYFPDKPGVYFLISESLDATAFKFKIEKGLIDNITEAEL